MYEALYRHDRQISPAAAEAWYPSEGGDLVAAAEALYLPGQEGSATFEVWYRSSGPSSSNAAAEALYLQEVSDEIMSMEQEFEIAVQVTRSLRETRKLAPGVPTVSTMVRQALDAAGINLPPDAIPALCRRAVYHVTGCRDTSMSPPAGHDNDDPVPTRCFLGNGYYPNFRRGGRTPCDEPSPSQETAIRNWEDAS